MFVYILKCSDSSYYIGITNNLERRFNEHCESMDEKSYTFNRRPLKLVYYEHFLSPMQAIKREKQLKGWSRKKKEALINGNIELLKELAKSHGSTSWFGRLTKTDNGHGSVSWFGVMVRRHGSVSW